KCSTAKFATTAPFGLAPRPRSARGFSDNRNPLVKLGQRDAEAYGVQCDRCVPAAEEFGDPMGVLPSVKLGVVGLRVDQQDLLDARNLSVNYELGAAIVTLGSRRENFDQQDRLSDRLLSGLICLASDGDVGDI